jgi:hypothetical protein
MYKFSPPPQLVEPNVAPFTPMEHNSLPLHSCAKISVTTTWWQGFCQGDANTKAYCLANQEIVIDMSMYGDQACSQSSRQFSTFPTCGKYVTDILAQECNGKLLCSIVCFSICISLTKSLPPCRRSFKINVIS